MKPIDVEIVISTKDDSGEGDSDNLYRGIVMGLYDGGWCNTGIVVRRETALEAFTKCVEYATKEGLWH